MCGIFHWLFGNYCLVNVLCYVNLRLYISQFVVCWSFGAAGDIKLVFHTSTITMMHGPINIKYIFSLFNDALYDVRGIGGGT